MYCLKTKKLLIKLNHAPILQRMKSYLFTYGDNIDNSLQHAGYLHEEFCSRLMRMWVVERWDFWLIQSSLVVDGKLQYKQGHPM